MSTLGNSLARPWWIWKAQGFDFLREDAALAWYDTTPDTLKTDAVAKFVSANTESLSIEDVNQSGLVPGTAFSVAVWVKIAADDAARGIVGRYRTASNKRGWSIMKWGTGNAFKAYYSQDGSDTNSINGAVASGDWQLLVLNWDGATFNFYVDDNAAVSHATTAIHNTDYAFTAGLFNGSSPMEGNMSHMAYWNRAISAAEVAALYNSGTPRPLADLSASELTGLISFWHLNEPGGVRMDAYGTNHLTDINTVGVAHGDTEYNASNGAAITRWVNRSLHASAWGDLSCPDPSAAPAVNSSGLPNWSAGSARLCLDASGHVVDQPFCLALVVKRQSGDAFFDSHIADGDDVTVQRIGGFNQYEINAGTAWRTLDETVNERLILVVNLDGSSSMATWHQAGACIEYTGDPGANSLAGLSVGDNVADNAGFVGVIEAVIVLNRTLNNTEINGLLAL